MQARTVRRFREPSYPTKLTVRQAPGPLLRRMPAPWKRSAELAGAAAVLVAAASLGGQSRARGAPALAPVAAQPTTAPANIEATIAATQPDYRVISGCIVVVPPTYLSEEDALQVIKEELGKVGVNLTKPHVTHKKVLVPQRKEQVVKPATAKTAAAAKPKAGSKGKAKSKATAAKVAVKPKATGKTRTQVVAVPGTAKPLTVDLEDPRHHIAVEFLSESDYVPMGGVQAIKPPSRFPSGTRPLPQSFRELSKNLEKNVKKAEPTLRYRAFYDPEGYSAESSRRMLRQQVVEFAKWLKAQGAI